MVNKIVSILALFIFLLLNLDSTAQERNHFLNGKVIDHRMGFPIPHATIKEIIKDSNTVLNITVTNEDGFFELKTTTKKPLIIVEFLGYEKIRLENISIPKYNLNLGTILLKEAVQNLDEFEVEIEKSTMEFKLDKRVFNVGKDISSTGVSALEVLNNVPSVNVNIEGQISLRGANGVQVLINSKPSVLASEQGKGLGTITADMIEKIEVITNPSAKYEAEGSAGIINIVLKKEERRGLNGSISLNTGIPHNHSTGVSLNKRTEKLNLFTQLGIGYRSLPRIKNSRNKNFNSLINLESSGIEYRNELYYNLILGADYYINENSLITLSGSYALEIEDQPSSFLFEMDSSEMEIGRWERNENTAAINPKYQYDLSISTDLKFLWHNATLIHGLEKRLNLNLKK